MSAAGYEDMLEKYRDVDEDAIMCNLTEDELAQLENEIDREILEKPPEYEEESEGSDVYTTTSTSDEESEVEEQPEMSKETKAEESVPISATEKSLPKGKPEAFTKGKLDRSQLKPVQRYCQQRHKSGGRHTFKVPALKRTQVNKTESKHDDKNSELKNELIQAVSTRDKKRTRRAPSSGIGGRRMSGAGVPKGRRNSKVIRYRDGNEHQIDAATVNKNSITNEMISLRPRLKKVNVKEPKLVLPEELHGVSFKRITAGAKKLQDEEDADADAVVSEDGDASRNSAYGGYGGSAYDADIDVTPSLSDESYAVLGEDCDHEEDKERQKALSECSEAPSDGVMTMASTASTSAESCDVFGELSINPNSVEEMVERVNDNDPMLTEVNLNNIHDVPIERFEELAQAMEGNTHVTSLMLANTGLTDRAARAMASMLKRNSKLKILNLESNFITGEGARRLVSALRKNQCLIELLLDNQRHIFGAKVEFEIGKLLKENKSLLKFGYQFANPGPRMATSNILTKNMDLVRRERVAEEKKRAKAGMSKRPVLRRQPSSEWYRRERLERIKNLQNQSKLLGLDANGNIGDVEVEKVLKNMNPEQVSLLERWFTSKLLGMVDEPPLDAPEKEKKSEETQPQPTEDPKHVEKQARGRKEDRMDNTKLTPAKNTHLRPPSNSRRSKSPVANRGELMDSIRKQNAKLKKVQVRPFESPTHFENTDSDSSDVRPACLPTQALKSPPVKARSPEPLRANVSTANGNNNNNKNSIAEVPKPTIFKTAPSFDDDAPKLTSELHGMGQDEVSPKDMEAVSGPTEDSECDEEKVEEEEEQEEILPPTSSSPEVREWHEGEEYDSDEYEVVEIEVTDSDEEGGDGEEAIDVMDSDDDIPATVAEDHSEMANSVDDVQRESERSETSPDHAAKYRSAVTTKLNRPRFEQFGKSHDSPEPNPYEAILNRQNSNNKPEVYDYLDSKMKSQSSRNSPRSNPLSPSTPRLTPRSPQSPDLSRFSPRSPQSTGFSRSSLHSPNTPSTPGSISRSPQSPGTAQSPLLQAGSRRLDSPALNRSVSSSSSASTESNRFPSRARPSRTSRSANDSNVEEINICPKAMSTIESFFSFK